MEGTEITVQVFEEFADINKKLLEQNFKMIENYQLNDWYFIKFDKKQIRELSYGDLISNSILVRQIIDDMPMQQICYKKKKLDINQRVMSEEKIVSKIENLENALKIFRFAGLNEWCSLKNNSYVYKKGDIQFCLQIIENLGIFIEYEDDFTMNNLSEQEKIEKMSGILKKLNLNLGNSFSCKKVYMKFLKDKVK